MITTSPDPSFLSFRYISCSLSGKKNEVQAARSILYIFGVQARYLFLCGVIAVFLSSLPSEVSLLPRNLYTSNRITNDALHHLLRIKKIRKSRYPGESSVG